MRRWLSILGALSLAHVAQAQPGRQTMCDAQARFVMLAADLRDAQQTPQQVYQQTTKYVVPGMGMSEAWRKRAINTVFFDHDLAQVPPEQDAISYRAWCMGARPMKPLR